MFIHDILKIKYIEQGYLPNHPYRMITDEEMFDAFLRPDGYFGMNYPCVNPELQDQYDELVSAIKITIQQYLETGVEIPSWVYSYMIGSVISVNADQLDLEYLCDLLNVETPPQFDAELAEMCYDVSKDWIRKLPSKYVTRPASVFGELHVIKSLRLKNVDVLS